MKKFLKWLIRTLVALVVLLVVAVSVVLSPKVLTGIVNKAVAPYVDGTASIGRAKVSLLRTFPDIRIELDSILVTYPHDTFAAYGNGGINSPLLNAGCGESVDTLAGISVLKARANYVRFLKNNEIRARDIVLSGVRSFAHVYDGVTANWDIIHFPASEDTTSSPAPKIIARDITVEDIYDAVFTSPKDTMFLGTRFKDFRLKGDVSIIDGIFSATADLLMDGNAHFQNASLGRIEAPVFMEGGAKVDIDGATSIDMDAVTAKIACIPLDCDGKLIFAGDSTFVGAKASVTECPVGSLLEDYGQLFSSLIPDIRTDALLSLNAEADGWFGSATGLLPLMKAEVSVPDSHISYVGLVDDGKFDLSLKAENNAGGIVHAELEDLCFAIEGVDLKLKGTGDDLLGEDPRFDIKAFACTQFAQLVQYLPKKLGISADGDVDVELEGKFKLSDLSAQDIHKSDLVGHIFSDGIRFSMPKDTLFAYASHPDIRFNTATMGNGVGLTTNVDSLRFISGASTFIMGRKLALKARNSGAIFSKAGKLLPLSGELSVESFNLMGTDSLMLGIRESSNGFDFSQITEEGAKLPKLSVTSSDRMAYVKAGPHRFTVAGAEISASAQKRNPGRAVRGPHRRENPDSTFRRRAPGDTLGRLDRSLPDFLQEIEFRKKDIKIDLGEGLAKLIDKWIPTASVKFDRATAVTPAIPLRNSIHSFDGELTEDQLSVNKLRLNSGQSDVSLKGRLTGIAPLLAGQKDSRLGAVINLDSRMLNLNELIAAVNAGSQISVSDGLDDETYEESIVLDNLAESEEQLNYSLIVIPANLDANVTIGMDSVRYSKLTFSDFKSRIKMRERCLQLTNTSAASPLGNASLDAFYSTKTKSDISAGFNVRLDNITADRIIEIIPAVDSLVPMLKSFKGLLDCEVAATSQLDTNMNIQIPSINGVVKINGSGLELSDTGDLRRIAKILMFNDTKVGHIDDLSVNGIIADNRLEIFPFILGVDRYTLGLSGLQGFDQNFKYHISVIKSPLPFKFGINLKGNFDNWGFTLGRARYTSTSVPLFAPQVDTMQVNLVTSIKNIFRKGVDAALREHDESRRRIDARREEFGLYEDDEEEDLSTEERDRLDDYMLDLECEEESRAIEDDLNGMFGDDFTQSLLEELLGNL